MKFPVDLLATVEPEALEQSAKDYMSKLLYRNPEIHEFLSLPDSSEVEISLCNVSFVPLYGVDIKQKVLALFSPEDRFKAVGLYLLGQWWSAEDILKTADSSRTGLLEVRTSGERIALYVLNRIIYRTKEKASDDIHFLCHEEHAVAKILWKSGEAIGFYSVKPEGSLCSSFVTQCYQLPIMDTIFIRKHHRGNGYGLQMLEDFVRSFKKDCLGLKYPLSPAMYKVCKNYLSTYPADKELLWEVEGIGGLFQRTLIAKKLQTMELKGDHEVVGRLNFETESTDVPMEKVMTQVQKTMEYTMEVVEEVVQIKIRKEVQDTPVTTRGRSSNLKRKKLGEEAGATTDKIIRVEDIEAAVQSPVDESMEEVVRSSLSVTETNLKETAVTVTHGEENVIDVTQVQCEEHKELFTEPEESVLEVCALAKPITEQATVTPEEARERTGLSSVAEIQSLKSSEKTQVVKSFEATVGLVDLQPVELQQVVEVEIVKMTSGIKEVKEKNEDVTGTKDSKGEVEEEIAVKTLVAAANVVEEARAAHEEITCMQKPSQQTELDLKPVLMEESTTTEIRVVRKSSRVSNATPQWKSTRLHNELQVAIKPCTSEAKAAPKERSTQEGSAQAVGQPENEEGQEMRKKAKNEMQEVVDIVQDTNKVYSVQSKIMEETDDMNEEVLTGKDKGSPQDVFVEGEDMKIDCKEITTEEICQEGKKIQNHSEIESREKSSVNSLVELAAVQYSETSEELSEPEKLLYVARTTDEVPEVESVEKEKIGGEVEKIALSESVVGVDETEEKNENMEIEEGTVNEVQEEEHVKDASMVQESVSEKKMEPEVQKPSHDNEVKSENRTELTEVEDAEKASSSHPTGKRDDGQRSNNATPLRRSQRFKGQPQEDELKRRVLRSGTKSITTPSKQKYVRRIKTVKQQEESAQAEGEHEVDQKEEIMESHTGVAEGEKMETVRITSVEDNEHVKDDSEEKSSVDKGYFEPETSDHHDLKKVEDVSLFKNKVDEEHQVTNKDASLEDAETSRHGIKMDDADVQMEAEGKSTLQSIGEPAEEQEEEAREKAQKKEVLKTQSLVEIAEKEQTDSEQLVKMADTLNTVMTEVVDKTETEENSKEKMENEMKSVSKNEDTAPGSTDSDQGFTEVVQEEELIKESKLLQEIPSNEELEIEDISKPGHGDSETAEEILQSPEEGNQEFDKIAGTDENREESKEEEEVVQQTESLVESAEKDQAGENETSVGSTQPQDDVAEKEEAFTEMEVEESMTKSLKEQVVEVGAGKMLKTDSEQEESILAEEKLKDDGEREIIEEETGVAVAESIAEMCTRNSEKHQEEDQERVTTGHEEGVQESSTEEETPVITSRSLRRKTVTVMSSPQRKSKHLQKTEVELAQNEHAVLVEVTDNTDEASTEETKENEDEKMEAEDSAGSKDKDRVPKSSDTDQGQVEVVQEEEPLKETKTLQEIPGNEETEIKEVSKPFCCHEEDKSDNWTEPIAEKDSDKADNSGSTGKYADSRRPNYATPLRHSERFKDQPVEGELTKRFLRSGSKTITAISKEKSIRHTKTMKNKGEVAQAVGEPEVEQKQEAMESLTEAAQGEKVDGENSENPSDSLQKESKVEREYLEAETTHDHDHKEIENKTEDGLQNETIEYGKKIVVVDLDEAEVVKDAGIEAEGKTGQELGEEQVEEPAKEMAQKEDGENVVESTSDYTQQKADVVSLEVPCKQTDNTETTKETSQSPEEADQELDKPASTQEDTDETKDEEEVVKQTQSRDEPAEKEETGGNQTSTETLQSQEGDWLKKADALAEMGVEEPVTEEQVVVDADKMPKSGSEQEESMLAEETLKDDRVGEITLDQESSAAVPHSSAEIHASESEKHAKEDQESKTSGHEETVQGSSSEEETPIIISRSLRRRMVTVVSPPQRKSKHLQKTEVELAQNEHVVLVQVTDSTGKGNNEEAKENEDEKMEAEDSVGLKDEDRVPKSTDTDQGQMEVVQVEELLKETRTLQDVLGNEETNIKDINKPSHGDEEKKSDNWTEPVEHDESVNTDNLGSTGKHAGKRSNYSTPLRRSQRFKDQPIESELTKRVLRSGTKTVTAFSKQRHVGHTKTVKQQEERAHAVGQPEVEQTEEIMESHPGVAAEEKIETLNATNERDNEKLTALQDRAQEDSGVEKEYLEAEATHDHDLEKVKNKMKDDSQNETIEDGKKIVVVDLEDAEVARDAEIEEKSTQQLSKEPFEEQEEEPATEIVQTEDGQNVVESMSVFTLQEAAVVLVDFNKVPPKQTGDSEMTAETLQSPEEGDEERDKLASTEENREESKEEQEMMKPTESLVAPTEKEQTGENETSTETTEEEIGVEEPVTERLKECVVEVGADMILKTAGEQEESVLTEEKLKDDRAGEITLEEKSGVAVAESTAEMYTSESEKHQTDHQEKVTTGHEEAVKESSTKEETPIIISRSLRRRTITVMSTSKRKSKHLQKTEVEMAENENVQMTEVMEKIDKSSIEETEENKDGKMETEVSAVPNDDESPVIDQGQMEVVEEVEHVKETNTPQEIPGNEESTIKELIESDLADKTEVADSYPAEVVKDAETEENKDEVIEAEDSTILKYEDRVPESTDTDQSRMEVEGPAVEMIPGQGEQKAEETTAGLKLQKASVVLVDFNKVPPKETMDSVTAKETSLPQEEVCQELDTPADISVYIEGSKAEDEGIKQIETLTESAEREQTDEDVVKIAESENVEKEDVKNKTAEGTSEIRDNDEKMETEGDGGKGDEDRVPELISEKEPAEETSTLQEIPSKSQIQEPSQADDEKSDNQTEEEFSDTAHKADRGKQEVGTPVRHSRRFADQPTVSELTTRVLRSSTKQVKATPKQRYTWQTKAMVQNEESERTVDKPEEKREIKELQNDVPEGEKMETVTTEGTTENLITPLGGRVEENNELEAKQIEESVVAKHIISEQCSEEITTEGEVDEAAVATTDEEKISDLHVSDIAKDAEMEVEEKTPAQSVTEPVEEQAEAPVTEMAQNEDGQNEIKPTSAFALQKATVVLVDFNRIPPIQTVDSETTDELSQSQKEVDKQTNIDEDRDESNEDDEVVNLTESLVESAEKEHTVGDEAAQPQNTEGLDKADVLEENEPLAEMVVEEPMTENLEEPVVDVGADNLLKTGNEQEETVLAEEKLKVGDIMLEAESTATVSVCTNENQKDNPESITTGYEETVQESSAEEETPVITSRSLRRRTVTVISPPQRKSKHVKKPGVQADSGKAEAVKDTDVSEAEKTPAICLPKEVSMPERDGEDASEHGKVCSGTETQVCILEEQGTEALVAHEMPEIELKMLADEGDTIMKESENKEKGEMASDTAVSADAEATTIEAEKVLQVKSTEVDHEKDESIDKVMVLLVQDSAAQEKELEIPTGSPTNVVIEATTKAEGMVESEVDSLGKESNQNTSVTKPAQETTEEEVPEEEEEPIMTRNLRSRTVTAKYPMQRKSKRLCQEVVETPVKNPQLEKEAALVEASNERETVEPITVVEEKNEIKITETDSSNENEDAQWASEGTSKEVITLEEQGGENIAETDGGKMEKITDEENEMVEGVPEDKVEERTTEGANNEEVGMEICVEGSDLIDNDMEKEADKKDKEEEGNTKPEQENNQEENILDKVEAQLLEEKSEGEFSLVKEKTQIKEPEKKEKLSTTEETLDEVEEALSVERRSLRKRTITIKATSERKSKRMRKQNQDETEQVHVYMTEDPLSVQEPVMEQADVKSLADKETTGQEIANDSEKDGETLLEKVQEQESPEGAETCGETNISTEKEKGEPEQAQSRELVNVSEEETDTKTEAQEVKKAEEKGEEKAEADECKEEAAEHENKITDKGGRTADTVKEIKKSQEEAEPNEKKGNECNEISLSVDESFTLELEEEEENNGPQENKVVEEMEASLMERLNVASTKEHITDQEEESAVKKRQVLQERSSAAASPEQRSPRRSKRFLMESQSEMEGRSEVEVAKEKEKPQQKRKAIVDLTPRRSKRLARPKIV